MKTIIFTIIFSTLPQILSSQQENIKVLSSKELLADSFVGIDKFENLYYISNNTLFKVTENHKKIAFQDVLLGDISRVDILNPNKIIVFYQMANVVIVLDNRLTEIDRQDFNTLSPFKNVSHVGTSKDQSLWIYNIDFNQIELFDYRYDNTIARSLPIDEKVIEIKNNFNFCFLRLKNAIKIFNIYGSLVKHIPIPHIHSFDLYKNNLIVHTKEGLLLFDQDFNTKLKLKVQFEDYDSLFYKDEIIYLYAENKLTSYKLTSI